MYCANCGTQYEANDKFCPSCGTKIEEVIETAKQETAANLETGNNQPQVVSKVKKPFTLKKALIIAGIVVLAGAGTAAGFILHKSPKELYLLSEINSLKQVAEDVDSHYGDLIEFNQKTLEKPSSNETTLSGNFEIESLESDPDVQMVKDILSEASLTTKTEISPLTNEGYYSLGVNLADEEAVNVELYQSKEQLGLKIPALYEKFLYVNFNEFGEAMRMLDPSYDGPETLELADIDLNELKLTDKEKEHLQKKYTEFLLSHLKDEQFSLEKGINYKHDGTELKLRKVTFEMSPKESNQFMIDFIDVLIKDTELHNMLVKRVEKLSELAVSLDEASAEELNAKEMKEELIEGLKDAKEDLKDSPVLRGIKSELLIDNKEQVVDRKLTIGFGDDSSDAELVLTSKNVPLKNDNRYEELKIKAGSKEDETEVAFEMSNDIDVKKADNTIEKRKISISSTSYGVSDGKVDVAITSNYKGKSGSKQTVNHEFKIEASDDAIYDMPSGLSGTVVETRDVNLKKEYSNEKYEIELNIEDEYDAGSIMFTIDSKTKLKKKADLPQLNNDSSEGLNIAKITEEDIYAIEEEVYNNMMELAEKFGFSYEDMMGTYEEDYSGEEYYEDELFYEDGYYEDELFDEELLESY
ncbi:hypothetical protein CHH83_09055 [Bacillus sp. 7586-K]|nr:hypothetical protein CHH83_09055 [Bacillus sp. 7586-K]